MCDLCVICAGLVRDLCGTCARSVWVVSMYVGSGCDVCAVYVCCLRDVSAMWVRYVGDMYVICM